VDIIVDGKHFPCHRLILGSASEYFDVMFNSKFDESNAHNVVVDEIDASTFEQILRFIYTGEITVTNANLFSMIRACEFYKLPADIETHCMEYVEEEKRRVIDNAFEILTFIRLTKKIKLISTLSTYIRKHFHYFSKTPSFLNLSFDDLDLIVAQPSPSSSLNENVTLDAIVQWIRHSTSERNQYFDSLFGKIRIKNLSPSYVGCMVKQYVEDQIAPKKNKANGKAEDPQFHAYSEKSNALSLSLHMYICCFF